MLLLLVTVIMSKFILDTETDQQLNLHYIQIHHISTHASYKDSYNEVEQCKETHYNRQQLAISNGYIIIH